jgi:uncharacterized protein YodC (DUF2158 family)
MQTLTGNRKYKLDFYSLPIIAIYCRWFKPTAIGKINLISIFCRWFKPPAKEKNILHLDCLLLIFDYELNTSSNAWHH